MDGKEQATGDKDPRISEADRSKETEICNKEEISGMESAIVDCKESGKEQYLVLGDIHQFNPDVTFLSAGILADYISRLTH